MRLNSRRIALLALGSIVSGLVLSGCGGTSDGAWVGGGGGSATTEWQEGVFYAKSQYQNYCASPRIGNDPFNNNLPYPDRTGSAAHEKLFLRSWTNELYLWYNEVEDQDPETFTVADYFQALKTNQLTVDGAPKDNFHFSQDTFDYKSQTVSGQTFGYGMIYLFPPGEAIIRDVIPGSPAAELGVTRGMKIVEVNGTDVRFMTETSQIDTLVDALFTDASGEVHNFIFENIETEEQLVGSLTSGVITSQPVKDPVVINTASGDVGYLYFDAHTEPSEKALFDAFTELETAGVTDLILDLRYNGGGLLGIASEVAYMIAGDSPTRDEVFYAIAFNDKYPSRDPVTGSSLQPIPFYSQSVGYSSTLLRSGIALPTLNLNRVYVLTLGSTCSAAEAIINGLSGVGVEVIQIGSTTCGKPYGFYPQGNCGTTYFSIQFTGENAAGFGEYSSGFSPSNEVGAVGVSLPGCYGEDDLTKALGDENENLVAIALQHRSTSTCPTVSAAKLQTTQEKFQPKGLKLQPPVSPGTQNAILQLH